MNKSDLQQLVTNYLLLYPEDSHGEFLNKFLDSHNNFWQRENTYGHITASAWVVNSSRTKVLLTHHKKLNFWIQLGGHVDETDFSIYEASERELREESGLKNFKLLSNEIFDIDVHRIPDHKSEKEHFHLDIRLIFQGDDDEEIQFEQSESNLVKWIELDNVLEYCGEGSVMRMVRKTQSLISKKSI